jgi:hypothetical protein
MIITERVSDIRCSPKEGHTGILVGFILGGLPGARQAVLVASVAGV